MKELVVALYFIAAPNGPRIVEGGYKGEEAVAICHQRAAGMTELAREVGMFGVFWCEAPYPETAPWWSPIPKQRPEGLTK